MADKEEKHRRMELRRDFGNRQVKPVSQTSHHSSYPYLGAHACFNCQKSFKLSYEKDHVCPECGLTIYRMGRAFKAPKRGDREQWRKVQKLYPTFRRLQTYFWSCACNPFQIRSLES